ncbi:MAG: HdeD family acid-resistance protein [Pseudomonadota bacterium]
MTMSNAAGVGKSSLAAEVRAKWGWFLVLGIVLLIGGALAILMPIITTFTVSLVFGAVLVVGGLVQIIQSFQVKAWRGFTWHLLTGVIETIGGVLIYLTPFAGAIALTVIIAITFLVQGVTQMMLAMRVRPDDGWGWLAAAGTISLLTGIVLLAKFPIAGLYTPGIMVGVSLMIGGWAYIAVAMAARRLS